MSTSRRQTPTTLQSFREVYRYRELLRNLTQRELRSRYRRSVLGWGWSLLQPALMTAVYAIMLGFYFGLKPDPGDPSGIEVYAFFLLSGLLAWNFFSGAVTTAMGTVVNAGSLVSRVWFPRLLLPLSSILALAFSLCIELAILTTVVSIGTTTMLLHLLPVAFLLVVLLAVFASGIAFWLAACNVRFRDVEYLTGVLLLAYLYLTPVIYPATFVPDTVAFSSVTWRDLSLVNPMARFMMAFRNVFYDVRLPGAPTMLWLLGWSLVSIVLGTRFFSRRADRFAEVL
jgi:lipopolysaccharide transport system permease protein